jgi:hypothetical protein
MLLHIAADVARLFVQYRARPLVATLHSLFNFVFAWSNLA